MNILGDGIVISVFSKKKYKKNEKAVKNIDINGKEGYNIRQNLMIYGKLSERVRRKAIGA